jgi:hypothetical protein
MTQNLAKELAKLETMSTADLKRKYAELIGDEARSGNRTWLIRRVAWRMQANQYGGLSERARQRAAELANESDLRLTPPKVRPDRGTTPQDAPTTVSTVQFHPESRLPLPGSILHRVYKGRTLQVRVLENGFEYQGEVYRSLSAVAKTITGSHCNGFQFFNLNRSGQNG